MLSAMSNTEPLFVPEQLYHRRRDIHARFGGQEQGGMITPANHKLIFLVTGNSGRQHGYEDHWAEDGSTFFYFGEGQTGDMKFTKGNLALRDHVTNGEDVHLFEEVTEIRDQCVDGGIAFFFKQWGGVQKKKTGRSLEGRTWDQMPVDGALVVL